MSTSEPWRAFESSHASERERLYGLYPGLVTNNHDPENRGRVRVQFPWLTTADESWWARVATFYAGKGRGSFLMPEVGDEVMVAFEHGDFHHPYVVGSVWNGVDNVPGPGNPDGENNIKQFQSRSGHKLIFDDTSGAEKISLIDSSGNNTIIIDVAGDTITATAATGDIYIRAPAGTLNVECVDLNVSADNNATYDIGNDHALTTKTQSVAVDATQTMNVNARMEHTTPTITANISSVFNGTSAQANVNIGEMSATITSAAVTVTTVEKTLGEEQAQVDVYTLNTTSSEVHGVGGLAIQAGASHTVNGTAISAEGQQGVAMNGAMVSVNGGMIVFKGSSVMINSSV